MSTDAWLALAAAPGDLRIMLAGTALTFSFLVWRGHRDIARTFLLGIALTIAGTILAKLIGFVLTQHFVIDLIDSPSGHVALGTAFLGSLALIAGSNRSVAWRTALLAGAALVVLTIAYGRIANGAHTPFEILEGLFIALIALIPLALLLRRRPGFAAPVPAGPLVLILAALVTGDRIFDMRDLNTEFLIQMIAVYLPIAHN